MKKVLIFSLLLVSGGCVMAQREVDEDSKSFKDRVYFGGGLGINGGTNGYGNRYFYVAVSPTIGYMVTNSFSAGTNLTWQHYSYPDIDQSVDQYGFSPFVRQNFGQLFLYSEFQVLNSPTFNNSSRRNYNRGLIGVGFTQPVGKRGAINAMGLYDVLYNQSERVFASPWVFRVYFSF